MIKMKVLIFMAILKLTLTGCGKAGQERLIIYSFSGENEQLAVSNGIIVLNGTEETFVGGDLKVTGDFFDDITSYSTTFYTMSGSEKDIILSNSVVDMTGGTVNVSSDLGQISGESTIRRINIDDANDLENTLYFELAVKDKNGKESVYQLQMSLTEITQNLVRLRNRILHKLPMFMAFVLLNSRNTEILIKIPVYQEINKTRICGGKIHETDRFIKTD